MDDTEDLVAIELSQHRNQLISVDLVINALTTAFALCGVITGTWVAGWLVGHCLLGVVRVAV